MNFGDLVKSQRKRAGLSLRETAERVGVNQSYLSRVEAGRVPPSDQLIAGLASVLSCSADELLLLAGRVPQTFQRMVERSPYQAAETLRNIALMTVAEPGESYGQPLYASHGKRAIEDGFPFEYLSEVAEVESWRKEVYRPVYHMHKWWAQRLGSVFRGAILGATAPAGSAIMDLFWQPVRLPGVVVFDPFMGSGTTVGEAHKLGCTAIGRDINAVAARSVRTALSETSEHEVRELFALLDAKVGKSLRRLYRGIDSKGREADVLYFFWVKRLPCPACSKSVRLFSTQIFARHAYTAKNPQVHIVCPDCAEVFPGLITDKKSKCPGCASSFDPHEGTAERQTATCRECKHEFAIAKAYRALGAPPEHDLYAKLMLTADGEKEYLRITADDLSRFEAASKQLAAKKLPLPRVEICDGHNTKQALNYGYRHWSDFFNDRQSLALATLARAIQELPEGSATDALATLFSGALEFNNMFASYKGEGTGAVRHMFSHHVLKPERMPIEANVWGTPKSSGAFSTLFESRLVRALAYKAAPFELAVEYDGKQKKGRKIVGISPPMGAPVLELKAAEVPKTGGLYVSCGDSSKTGMPDASVDLVLTDPPFFDNVHYSELADFFFVWQELYFGAKSPSGKGTTRHKGEVQDTDVGRFATKLQAVFGECCRVLKDEGLLVFSYHHSRDEGWSSVCDAVLGAGFSFVQAQPVKAEMSVAAPKAQAKEPIDLDVMLVCRKRAKDRRERALDDEIPARVATAASSKVQRFNKTGRQLSRNDVRVVVMSQLLVEASPGRDAATVAAMLGIIKPVIDALIERLWGEQTMPAKPAMLTAEVARVPGTQLGLLDRMVAQQ
jgi:putative DNA methylase